MNRTIPELSTRLRTTLSQAMTLFGTYFVTTASHALCVRPQPRIRPHSHNGDRHGEKQRKTTLPEPVEMLIADHREVQKMFKQFEKLKEQDDDQSKRDLVAEALIEHNSAKELIAKLQGSDANAEEYAAMFTVLGEYVNHHIAEEQNEMFPKLKKADLDWDALTAQMQERKGQLQEEMGLTSTAEKEEAEEEATGSARRSRREPARGRRSPAAK